MYAPSLLCLRSPAWISVSMSFSAVFTAYKGFLYIGTPTTPSLTSPYRIIVSLRIFSFILWHRKNTCMHKSSSSVIIMQASDGGRFLYVPGYGLNDKNFFIVLWSV